MSQTGVTVSASSQQEEVGLFAGKVVELPWLVEPVGESVERVSGRKPVDDQALRQAKVAQPRRRLGRHFGRGRPSLRSFRGGGCQETRGDPVGERRAVELVEAERSSGVRRSPTLYAEYGHPARVECAPQGVAESADRRVVFEDEQFSEVVSDLREPHRVDAVQPRQVHDLEPSSSSWRPSASRSITGPYAKSSASVPSATDGARPTSSGFDRKVDCWAKAPMASLRVDVVVARVDRPASDCPASSEFGGLHDDHVWQRSEQRDVAGCSGATCPGLRGSGWCSAGRR